MIVLIVIDHKPHAIIITNMIVLIVIDHKTDVTQVHGPRPKQRGQLNLQPGQKCSCQPKKIKKLNILALARQLENAASASSTTI